MSAVSDDLPHAPTEPRGALAAVPAGPDGPGTGSARRLPGTRGHLGGRAHARLATRGAPAGADDAGGTRRLGRAAGMGAERLCRPHAHGPRRGPPRRTAAPG